MGKKQEEAVERYSAQQIREANNRLDEFINSCSSEVFRTFLPDISTAYEVLPRDSVSSVSDTVAYFEVGKFVENEREQMVDCLKSVYHVLSNSGCSVALVIHRKENVCKIGLAVGNQASSSERTIKDTIRLRDSFLGNFPGAVCGDVKTDSDSNSSLFKLINSEYVKHHSNSLAIVSNVATEFTEDYSTQGIERLLDGIRPSSADTEYMLIILGEALRTKDLEDAKELLYSYYTKLSPYASEQRSISISEAAQSNWNWSVILSGHSWGKSVGTDTGSSVDMTNYKVKHTLDVIDKQMERLEESAALGLWSYAAYVISPDLAVTNEVAHMFMSLTQGRGSYSEQPAINIWNGQDSNAQIQVSQILNELKYLRHPRFSVDSAKLGKEVTATTIVSGAELARALSFPQNSVPGFPVYKCARFGRNISTYNARKSSTFEIGRIYHMRQIEKTPVALDKMSLASHVFITGSTGSGKSNTVFQLLNGADVPFLVIEPAKGEYKYVFCEQADVKVFGTNSRISELLRINPFSFPESISVNEHIDRLVELFNVCWPMYAAMPAILKDAVIKAYEVAGWNMERSENKYSNELFPTFGDVLQQIRRVLSSSDYSNENKSDYTGALVTRLSSLTNGINGQIFTSNAISDSELFDSKVIIDLSRVGSTETKAMIMGLLVIKLQEYRMSTSVPANDALQHITVLEEAHNILKRTSTEQTSEGANLLGKAVEMLANSIAELRAFGESFIIADQAPGLLDMAVIRNTNTKIIHRLPDYSDRELAGKAAGLNDEQINELAKLELGVAAVYQNEWIEPVLCQVHHYQHSTNHEYKYSRADDWSNDTEDAREMVRRILLNPKEYIKVDMSLIMRSNLPAQIKVLMIKICDAHSVHEDEMAKAFCMLYPKIRLDFRKTDEGKYLEKIYADITESCGLLNPIEMKVATTYLLAVSRSLAQITIDEYTKIRKEITSYD